MNAVSDHYSRLCEHYTDFHSDWSASIARDREALTRLFDRLGVPRGARILDATCGAGTQVIALAEAGYDVSGIDISAGMLDLCRTELERRGARASLSIGNVCTLGDHFQPGAFDAVISCGNSLPLVGSWSELSRALSAVRHVLANGAPFVGTVFDYTEQLRTQPRLNVYDIHGTGSTTRFWVELAEWNVDEQTYVSDIFFVNGVSPDDARTRRYRFDEVLAVTPPRLEQLSRAEGFDDMSWMSPEETGLSLPAFVTRPCKT